MRARLATGIALAGLIAGCSQPVPDSGAGAGAGVGFGDYASYELERARREAALTGAPDGGYAAPAAYPVAPTLAAAPAPLPAAPGPSGISATELAAVGIGAATPPVSSAPLSSPLGVPLGAMPGAVPTAIATATPVPGPLPAPMPVPATPAAATAPGDAAAASPSSAAAIVYGEGRLGATQITPGSLPATAAERPEWSPEADPLRPTGLEAQPGNAAPVLVDAPAVAPVADTGPNIVEYALSAPNAKGQEYYSRFAFAREGRAQRNCAEYRSADEAQRDFLARGGPERDARGLDPDGDGFACGWDPAPFRAAVAG